IRLSGMAHDIVILLDLADMRPYVGNGQTQRAGLARHFDRAHAALSARRPRQNRALLSHCARSVPDEPRSQTVAHAGRTERPALDLDFNGLSPRQPPGFEFLW